MRTVLRLAWVVLLLGVPAAAVISGGGRHIGSMTKTLPNMAVGLATTHGQNDANDMFFANASGVHSAKWYRDQCTEIKVRCEARKEDLESTWNSKIRRLEDEYKAEAKVLCRETTATETSQESVETQHEVVTSYREKIDEAKIVYEETRTCVGQLRKKEYELEELASDPDETEASIRQECLVKTDILHLEKCVTRYTQARSTLSRLQSTYVHEKSKLSKKSRVAESSTDGMQEYVDRAEEARRRVEEARSAGYSKYTTRIEDGCERKMVALRELADTEVTKAEAEYREQVDFYKRHEEEHEDTRRGIVVRTERLSAKRVNVEEAQRRLDRYSHCPAQLEKAEEELSKLQSIPNQLDSDIEDECNKKTEILKIRNCVDAFREARDVLTRERACYEAEKALLSEDEAEVKTSHSFSHSYQRRVRHYEAVWESAQASRSALHECAWDLLHEEAPRSRSPSAEVHPSTPEVEAYTPAPVEAHTPAPTERQPQGGLSSWGSR